MRFHRARFQNFVVLRDVELRFSVDPSAPVTVIRAANGSGKTTCLRALEWTLYGDKSLPTRGKYDIQPIDWRPEKGPIEVSTELEFSVTHEQRKPGVAAEEVTERYTLMRKADVRVNREGELATSTQKPMLLRQDETGYTSIPEPQTLIDGWLPLKLREFFFTDGDEALAYIAADESSARRGKVEGAVKALLGVDLVEAAAERISTTTARELRKQAAKESGESDLEALAEQIERQEDELDKRKTRREELVETLDQHERTLAKLSANRDKALEKGNKEELKQELNEARDERKLVRERRLAAQKDISRLLRHPALEAAILRECLKTARELLEPLHRSGRIPASNVPFLRDRLEQGRCVCGADLTADLSARQHVEELLEDSASESDAANRLNEIFTEAGELLRRIQQPHWHWPTFVVRAIATEEMFRDQDDQLGRQIASLEDTIAALPNTDIQTLTEAIETTRAAQGKLNTDIAMLNREIEELESQLLTLKERAAKVEARVDKVRSWRAAETAADDIGKVLQATLGTLKHDKVAEVSEKMDRLFREMIIADADNAIIRHTVLTPEYDITVEGPGRIINPDTELNGASRRALTVAFILALAEVSGVAAPNVIDTPLGMTSGETRRSLFNVAAQHSSQLILFLTRSEIEGIEDLLRQNVGEWHTLTAMAHYPTQIVNRSSPFNEALVCPCDASQYCTICQRIGDVENPKLTRRD